MKKIIVGVMPKDQFQKRMLDIAAGRVKHKRGEPKIWSHSMKSLAEVLSDSNRELLKIIASEEPETISELAELTGRQLSNLGRTLRTFEHYGFVRLEKTNRAKKSVAIASEIDVILPMMV